MLLTPTHSVSPTASATPTVPATPPTGACGGDCDGNGSVTVNELVRGVGILLGLENLTNCPDFDVDRSGDVTVDELITAMNFALGGCANG